MSDNSLLRQVQSCTSTAIYHLGKLRATQQKFADVLDPTVSDVHTMSVAAVETALAGVANLLSAQRSNELFGNFHKPVPVVDTKLADENAILTKEVTRLTDENRRVMGEITKLRIANELLKAEAPRRQTSPKKSETDDKPKNTQQNFSIISDHDAIVHQLRYAGWRNMEIFEALDAFISAAKAWDGELTIHMIEGVNVIADLDYICKENNNTFISRPEVIAMSNALSGSSGNVRPMEKWMAAHCQKETHGFMSRNQLFLAILTREDTFRLRQAFKREMALRERLPIYKQLSIAFWKLKKTLVVGPSMITPQTIVDFGEKWFGDDAAECLIALTGCTEQQMHDIWTGDDIADGLETLIYRMQTCLEGLDVDDPEVAEKVAARS